MTDAELNKLLFQLGTSHRRRTVASLLRGNDTQCFTVEQYARMYHKVAHKDDPRHRDSWIKWLMELAPQHLRSLPELVREISPGIWAARMEGAADA